MSRSVVSGSWLGDPAGMDSNDALGQGFVEWQDAFVAIPHMLPLLAPLIHPVPVDGVHDQEQVFC